MSLSPGLLARLTAAAQADHPLSVLTPRQRLLFLGRAAGGLTIAQIAREMRLARATVYRDLMAARERLARLAVSTR